MIKCNVTIIGTISRSGEAKADKEGRPFFIFGVQTVLSAKSGINKTIDISVAKDGECNPFDYATGVRVKIQGTLTFRKRDDNLYYNLSASNVEFDVTEEDSIKGTMSFRGTLGGKEILEKKGKKGAYRIFDAYSSEKVDDSNYAYTWVHFVDFTAERPSWLTPKTGINAEGELELSVFNDKENINCRITSLSLWDKQNPNQ